MIPRSPPSGRGPFTRIRVLRLRLTATLSVMVVIARRVLATPRLSWKTLERLRLPWWKTSRVPCACRVLQLYSRIHLVYICASRTSTVKPFYTCTCNMHMPKPPRLSDYTWMVLSNPGWSETDGVGASHAVRMIMMDLMTRRAVGPFAGRKSGGDSRSWPRGDPFEFATPAVPGGLISDAGLAGSLRFVFCRRSFLGMVSFLV